MAHSYSHLFGLPVTGLGRKAGITFAGSTILIAN